MSIFSVCAVVVLLSTAAVVAELFRQLRRLHRGGNVWTGLDLRLGYADAITAVSNGTTPLSLDNSSQGSGVPAQPNRFQEEGLCSRPVQAQCVLAYVVVGSSVVFLLLAMAWCLHVGLWKCSAGYLCRRWRSIHNASSEENDSATRYRDAGLLRPGLFSGNQRNLLDLSGSEGERYASAERHRSRRPTVFDPDTFNLLERCLVWVLQRTLYSTSSATARCTGLTGEQVQLDSIAIDPGVVAAGGTIDFCAHSRGACSTAPVMLSRPGSKFRIREEFPSTPTTTDSKGGNSDCKVSRDVCRAEVRARECDSSHEGSTAVEHPVLCDLATDEHLYSLRTKPQAVLQVSLSEAIHRVGQQVPSSQREAMEGGDNQQPDGSLAPPTCKALSCVGCESSLHTPLPQISAAGVCRHHGWSGACTLNTDASCHKLRVPAVLPRVETAIFNGEVAGYDDLAITDEFAEKDGSPFFLSFGDPPHPTVGSSYSDLECIDPPSEVVTTARPSPEASVVSCPPVCCQTEAGSIATNSVGDGIELFRGDVWENVMEVTRPTRGHVSPLPPQCTPPSDWPAPCKKRRSARYCEPWQPVPVPLKASCPGTAALVTGVRPSSEPDSCLTNCLQRSPDPGVLEGLLDDLVRPEKGGCVKSIAAGDGARVCTNSIADTFGSLTSAVQMEESMVGTHFVTPAVNSC